MPNADTPVTSRDFSRVDGKRAFILIAVLAVAGVCYWFMLPAIQSQIVPNAPGGKAGPWLVRPILAFHAGAMAVMTCVSLPVILWPMRKVWKREDMALGTQYAPFRGRPMKRVAVFVQGFSPSAGLRLGADVLPVLVDDHWA